jgi:AsmA protein
MRAVKLLAYVFAGFLALLLLLLLAAWLFVNPNNFKDQIAKEAKAATGRELVLEGDLHLSLFPWIAVETSAAHLGNPAGFDSEPFVSWKRASLRAKLWPLLHKQLEIGRIEIDGADLRLKKNADGKGNWEDFGKKSDAVPAATESNGASPLRELAGIRIKDSRVSYESINVEHLDVDIGRVAARAPVPMKASFQLNSGPKSAKLGLAAAFTATVDTEARQYRFAPLDLSGQWTRASGGAALDWKLAAPALVIDLQKQVLTLDAYTAELGAIRAEGNIAGVQIVDAPAMSGNVVLKPLSPRAVLAQFGIDAPKTTDPAVLKQLTLQSRFTYGGKAMRLESLDATLDDTRIKGGFALTNLDSMAMKFNLAVDHIDADRYLAPKQEPRPDDKPFELPSAAMKALDANGSVTVGQAKLGGIDFANVRMTVSSHGGLTHIFPSKAEMYGGQYSGDITFDSRAAVPTLKLDEHVMGIDMAHFLKDSMKSQRLSGRGNASAKITARGKGMDAILNSLKGRVETDLADGAIEGVDLWFELRRAQSLIKTHAVPEGASTKRTKFDSFSASADIADGVATTNDINVASQYLNVTGEGTTNLNTKALDYRLLAKILKTPPNGAGAELGELKSLEVPIKVTGTATEPKVRPDIEGIAKAKLKQKVDEKKDEIKQKLQDKLQDKLKGFFGGG